ncbi:MAG: hypothetical protein MR270_05120 [Erysipelotrichaceae bacterium]|nr:hypothetical protein [Erysipelotrichaceae bacterium]
MKKVFNKTLLLVLLLLLITLLAWYILESFLLSIAFLLLILISLLPLRKKYVQMKVMYHNIDALYNFVNLLNIQMLSTTSVYEAYKGIENYVDIDFANISSEDFQNQLGEIATIYNFNAFKMYINTLQIYMNDGGDFKKMEQIPTSLCQKTKSYYHKLRKNKLYKLLEITSLFLLWIAVIVALKVSIPDYYSLMMSDSKYQILMLAILLIGALLYYFAIDEYLKNKIKGL